MHSADQSAAIVKTSKKTMQKFIQISMQALSDSEVESVIIKFNCQRALLLGLDYRKFLQNVQTSINPAFVKEQQLRSQTRGAT